MFRGRWRPGWTRRPRTTPVAPPSMSPLWRATPAWSSSSWTAEWTPTSETRCERARNACLCPLTRPVGAGQKGATPMHHAAFCGQLDTCDALRCAGASVDIADSEGRTPFLLAAAQGHVAAMKWLVENGANARARAKVRHHRGHCCPTPSTSPHCARFPTSVSAARAGRPHRSAHGQLERRRPRRGLAHRRRRLRREREQSSAWRGRFGAGHG